MLMVKGPIRGTSLTQRDSEERTSGKGFKYRVPIRSQQNAVALRSLFLDIDCKGEGYASLNDAVVALAGFLKATGLPFAQPKLHGWHRHVSLVMLAFAMVAAIRHHANHVPLKKTLPRLPKRRRS